jgi:hypothetical protein
MLQCQLGLNRQNDGIIPRVLWPSYSNYMISLSMPPIPPRSTAQMMATTRQVKKPATPTTAI